MLAAACQVSPVAGHPDDIAVVVDSVRRAAAAGADLVVLPELAVTGWAFADMDPEHAARQTLDGPTPTQLAQLSAELGVVIVYGAPEWDGEQWWNAAICLDEGRLAGSYRKVHLWDEEKEWFAAASEPPSVIETSAGRVALMICYDLEFPEWVRLAAEQGAEVLAVPANWPLNHHPGQLPVEVAKAQASAAAYGVNVVVADRWGIERDVDWEGCSLICGADGYLLAGPATEPGATAGAALLLAELDPAQALDKSRGTRNHVFRDRRSELY